LLTDSAIADLLRKVQCGWSTAPAFKADIAIQDVKKTKRGPVDIAIEHGGAHTPSLVASDESPLNCRMVAECLVMDFTPEDMEAVQACLEGIDRNVPVTVEPAAAVLFMPNTVYTVGDILALPQWPAERLRLVVERWQPDIEVRIERTR
jgi:hypothetical protein